ncbi:MAG: hypothetical protein AAF235_02100 [Planctomycetota bacterium]
MSFGLGHGRSIDTALGVVAVGEAELPPLPDSILEDPDAARLDPRAWFEVPDRPLEIEIGSGKGTFLLRHASAERETNFLGIEWAHEFFAYAADRMRRRRASGGMTNVRMLHADATAFLRWRVPAGLVRVIHLYFSDPWPKARHHKKRVVQDRFMADVWRVLEPGGELRVVTDHAELWAWDERHFADWTAEAHGSAERAKGGYPSPPFERLAFASPVSAGDGELVGSNYERKWRAEGRAFYGATLRKLDGL